MKKEVTTYYLEMTDPSQLVPKRVERDDLTVAKVGTPCPEFNRFLYSAVGGDLNWRSCLKWNYERWLEHLSRPGTATWVVYVDGTPAGYAEMQRRASAEVEILCFGLLPQFRGQGFGAHLLTEALEKAWAMDARRVWLHTCTLDLQPHALSNYLARGMRVFKQDTGIIDIPDDPPAWPGVRPCTS